MITDEQLYKKMIRVYAFMRRNPHSAATSGDFMTMRTKGFGSILDILCETNEISQREIADRACIRQQSASEALSSLEARGYIKKKPSETDRRVMLFCITESGRTVQKELKEMRKQMAGDFFSCLNDLEKEALYNILSKLENEII